MRKLSRLLFSLNFLYVLLIAAETAAIIFLCLYLPAFMSVAAAFAGVWLITTIAAVCAATSRGSAETNCAAILFIIALPVAGAVIYFITRAGKRKCCRLKVNGGVSLNGEERAAKLYCGTGGADYDKALYFKSGAEYFSTLFSEIEKAQKYVCLEYFIVCRGKIFARLVSALRVAKSRGAEIKIIVDGIGSAFKAGRREYKTLKALGEVKIFNRLSPLLGTGINNRDHRKIAVVDGKVAFTGGFNIADEYANITGPFGYWKDTGVALYGCAAKVFGGMFFAMWGDGYEMPAETGGKYRCIPYCDSPPTRTAYCENAYLAAISAARRRVHVFTPYFCTGEKLTAALTTAAARGVDVRIIIPHIPDKKYALELSRACAAELSAHGVKFYEYTPGFMHAKSMVCDDKLYIGSYNMDIRSMRLNYECGVVLEGRVCEQAERDFWECVRLSAPFTEGKLSPPRRAVRFIIKLFAPLM